MKTKEAIELVDNRLCESPKKDQLFNLLKRGEKYEAMWEELNKRQGWRFYIQDSIHNIFLHDIMNKLSQKYFPKAVFKKTISFTIETPTEQYLGTAINDFEMFWADYNGVKGHCAKYYYAKEADNESIQKL